jgi:hypothetical protein
VSAPLPAAPAATPAGPVAQWLEPAAHNGLVAGSSPAGPTIEIKGLQGPLPLSFLLTARQLSLADQPSARLIFVDEHSGPKVVTRNTSNLFLYLLTISKIFERNLLMQP